MGSVGDCFDNAMAESFFATLECELLDRTTLPTHAAARTAVFEFIEGWYNTRRRHSALGYRSPLAFERFHQAVSFAREGVLRAVRADDKGTILFEPPTGPLPVAHPGNASGTGDDTQSLHRKYRKVRSMKPEPSFGPGRAGTAAARSPRSPRRL